MKAIEACKNTIKHRKTMAEKKAIEKSIRHWRRMIAYEKQNPHLIIVAKNMLSAIMGN